MRFQETKTCLKYNRVYIMVHFFLKHICVHLMYSELSITWGYNNGDTMGDTIS